MDNIEIKKQIERKKLQLATEKERHKKADESFKTFISGLSKQASSPSNIKSGASKSIRNQIASRKRDYARDKDARKRGYEQIMLEINRLKEKLKK